MTFRAEQFFVALLAAVAMMIATVPACSCSHHQPNTDVKTEASSCRHQTEQPKKDNAESKSFRSSDECICSAPQTIAVEKSNSLKIKKHLVLADENKSVEIESVSVLSTPAIYLSIFVEPEIPNFNIPRHRGPPRS